MRFEKLTHRMQGAIAEAQSLAIANEHQFIDLEHLLYALLQQQGGSTTALLMQAGVHTTKLLQQLQKKLDTKATVSGDQGDVHLSKDAIKLFNQAEKLANKLGDQYIASEHFVTALAQNKTGISQLLNDAGLNKQ